MITDPQYCAFLDKLAADVRGKNGIVLTEWESSFLSNYIGLPNNSFHFTDARRLAIDRMWRKYGAEIQHRHPLDVGHRPEIVKADSDSCQHLIRDGGRQFPCNDPAEYEEPGRLRYCRMHAEAVEQALKRQNKRIVLVKIQR